MKRRINHFVAGISAACVLAAVSSAQAELIYGINGANQLIGFDSAAPNSILSTVDISGANILNIDFNSSGVLYGLSDNNGLYTINLGTGAASLVGSPAISGGFDYGFDVSASGIRVVTDAGGNFRVNPANGALTTDTASALSLVGSASQFGITYGIDANLDVLTRTLDPNSGVYETIGSLGLDVTGLLGFDISDSGIAYVSLSEDGFTSQLYTINLLSGAVTEIGGIGSAGGDTTLDIATFAPIPEPGTALFGLALAGLAFLRRSRVARA
jgi:hypothetical protein